MIDSVGVRHRAESVGRELLVSHDTGWDPAVLLELQWGDGYDSIASHKHTSHIHACTKCKHPDLHLDTYDYF